MSHFVYAYQAYKLNIYITFFFLQHINYIACFWYNKKAKPTLSYLLYLKIMRFYNVETVNKQKLHLSLNCGFSQIFAQSLTNQISSLTQSKKLRSNAKESQDTWLRIRGLTSLFKIILCCLCESACYGDWVNQTPSSQKCCLE